jgi:alanyl-tRNA synthetase
MDSALLRESFVKYFRSNDHKFLAPTKVFNDDPTLFFVNSGMCQLKDVFLGKKEFDPKYSKLTNWQICVRAGGKHNDFEDVGKDSYHLTSFTMLGNWSLDSYWKKEAIAMAFDYLVNHCHLDKNRMYATYFEGNDKIPQDAESKELWKELLSDDHIVPGSFKDNFWSMAETGPCGGCTEIHYDLVGNRNVPERVNKDDPNVVEIWNIVFMEYSAIKNDDGTMYEPLAKKFVDTGAGHERLSMIVQNKKSIYEIDIFDKLFDYIHILGKVDRYTNQYGGNEVDKAYRIFADHMRTCVVALFDGAEFDCNKRGFILRKIFRRLLLNYYLHLNKYTVKPLTQHHIMSALITEILNYYLFKKHDAEKIRKMLEDEELLYVGKLYRIKMLYNDLKKKKLNDDEIESKLCNTASKATYGIDNEFVKNVCHINFEI